ncbi:MAG TPA: AraC family transcriptional regulator [Candidatus Eisenbergiella intestinipullorum]|nr:AraC family transcriptional regulator [Candidatus Eisenbergiella intestinipullorum]
MKDMKGHEISAEKTGFFHEVEQEAVQHGAPSFPCAAYLDRYQSAEDSCPWHWHEELEAAWVTRGTVAVFIRARPVFLHPGEGIFFNRRVPHAYCGTDGELSLMPNLLVRPSLIYGSQDSVYWESYLKPLLLAPAFSHVLLTPETPWQASFLTLFRKAFSLLSEQPFGYEFHVRSALSEALLLLFQNMPKATDIKDGNRLHQADADRIRHMLSYVQEHFTEPLSLQQIADSAFLSRRECLRCFQRTIGISPVQYIIDLRIRKARQLLLETSLPLLEICTECGFQDQSYFIKTFRERTGLSPARYRRLSGRSGQE